MMRKVDRRRTLDELDPSAWGEPEDYDSGLVERCHRLRKKPIGEFSVADLRVMIGQGFCLPWLVPLALDALEREPLVEGDHYPGDLLASVMRVPEEFWSREPKLRDRLVAVVEDLPVVPGELARAAQRFK